jgi:hypothetical protein
MADEVAKAVIDAKGESCPVSDGESCPPSVLVFGSACLPDPPTTTKGSCVPVSLDQEGDSSSEDSPWAWTKKVDTIGSASCPKKVDTTGGASCPDSPTLMDIFDKIEPNEETARAAKRKWREEWKGPAAGGSNMELGPRAKTNKQKKLRKQKNYLKKIARDQADMKAWREAELQIAYDEAEVQAWREAEHRGSG